VASAVATGHLNHATPGGGVLNKGYVRSLPKKRIWCGCLCHFRQNFKRRHSKTLPHRTSYNFTNFNSSLGEIGIAGRDTAYTFVVRARAMVLTGERTLSDTSGARKYCPRARETAADNYVYGLSGVLKNRLQRAHQSTD
jgi:hypothetical protein